MKSKILYLFFSLSALPIFAQRDTCDCNKNKPLTFPIILVGVGAINALDGTLDDAIYDFRQKKISGFRTHVDDYMLYSPLLAAYIMNLSGVKGVHNIPGLSLYAGTSFLAVSGLTQGMKYVIKKERPDKTAFNSFPSGHSSTAFCLATVFHKEYRKKSIWYSVAGYSVATATATLRVVNNRHWFSDVCMGAGLGIFTTEMTYRLLDKYFKKHQQVKLKPFY
ncbi:MAG: phosphatase PAP2 family protein [Saprospiraceae bacterium]